MDRLAIQASLSFILLVISYLSLYYALPKRTTFARYSTLVLLIASGAPLAVLLVQESLREAQDANIGLGMAFLLTWAISGVVLLVSLVLWILRLRKRR
ncbi:hypothetical protein R70723_04990 [Paenibacillus sp. FSL R7-0273]|uniref:hypothetical protein n=1 Tax=Paenibacillus sp. FSL R7-0273 TaxID=1536772 RepID=UPI0004F6DFDC|nr:hypothetical protein [Paenibacillus sp. FSL R7-0273]AIQ45324.1 hypothetical protein R70723_04990 [Paenibacillus sp. FSL R7-0273]OMF84010.1 hypothetical protein BK144_30995 [Paenibacillus sp. FSL R7-0273]